MGYIDLHLHSTFSDGLLSPSKLVALADKAGLNTIALSDHDTVAGVAEAKTAGIKLGLKVISGVELSVAFNDFQDIHLLGYCVDITSETLLSRLDCFAARRNARNRKMVEAVNRKLAEKGLISLELTEVEALADGVIGRPHIARVLMAHGYVQNMEQAFKEYLISCNVPKYYWPISEAINTIRQTGGVSVLAHPTSITVELETLESIVTELQKMGLDGIEVYNSMASEAEMTFLQRLANRLGLIVTGGSDFHGINPDESIGKGRRGIRFSDALLTPLEKTAAERHFMNRKNQHLSL